jgi:hypothetical protein
MRRNKEQTFSIEYTPRQWTRPRCHVQTHMRTQTSQSNQTTIEHINEIITEKHTNNKHECINRALTAQNYPQL